MFRFAVCLALLGLTVARQANKKEERGLDDGLLKKLIARLDESKRNEEREAICLDQKSVDCDSKIYDTNGCTYVYEKGPSITLPAIKVTIDQFIDLRYNVYKVYLDGEFAGVSSQGYEDDDELIETDGFDTPIGFFKLEIPILQGLFDYQLCLVEA